MAVHVAQTKKTIGLILEAIWLFDNFISSIKIEHVQTKKSKNIQSSIKIVTTTNDLVKHPRIKK
jgi:hypothetical protein